MPYKNKEDQLACQRRCYANNKEKYIKKYAEYRKKYYEDKKNFLNEIKNKLSCEICGENFVYCLEFHHKNPEEKDFCVSNLVYQQKASRKKILEEISKCKVLCANCHRKEHYK